MTTTPNNLAKWLIEKMPADVRRRVTRMATAEDVVHVAVLPDVHLSREYCVGTAVATSRRLFPHAVGGDIGCGMLAIHVVDASHLFHKAEEIEITLRMLRKFVPPLKHDGADAPSELPSKLQQLPLTHPRLRRVADRDGRYQLGTLGRGNHFLEFQRDESGELWIMLHSGSRAMGQAILRHHLSSLQAATPLPYLDAELETGISYLADVKWARAYASLNRRRMAEVAETILQTLFDRRLDWSSLIESDHNHVQREYHFGQPLWVHRKGSQRVDTGKLGIIPGSMGSTSFHVRGRGCAQSLFSSSHGAGRRLSRTNARRQLSVKDVKRILPSPYLEDGQLQRLVDEATPAYKDVHRVIKSQTELVAVVRRLDPIFTYKGL